MTTDPIHTLHHIPHSTLETFITTLLTANSIPASYAKIITHALTLADLRGIDSHGTARLPSYLRRIRAGTLSPDATPTVTQKTPVAAQVDGQNTFGFVTAAMAIDKAIEMAQVYGTGMVSVRRSNHFGMSAWIVQRAVDAGFMSLVFTNSSPALPVFGGREKVMGVSPIACGAPGGKSSPPFILDMAPSVAARGKIHKALRRGEKIPMDWALDRDGTATDDPAAALQGVMLPMGGPKGSALAIMMDVFSGVFGGSAFAGDVIGPYDTDPKNAGKESDVGHFIVAIKPDLWMEMQEFEERMDSLYLRVVGSEKAKGVERIYYPGERELLEEKARREKGVPMTSGEIEALNFEAERAGVSKLVAPER